MKHFKIGFLAIVALIAMSYTIVSKTGALKKSALGIKDVYRCASSDLKIFTYKDAQGNCVTVNADNDPEDDCPTLSVGTCIFDYQTVGSSIVDCPGGTKFCCADINESENCQSNCGETVKFGKTLLQIYCRQ